MPGQVFIQVAKGLLLLSSKVERGLHCPLAGCQNDAHRSPPSVVHSLDFYQSGDLKSFESTRLESSYILWARSLSQSFSQFLARDNNLNLVLVADGQMDKRTDGRSAYFGSCRVNYLHTNRARSGQVNTFTHTPKHTAHKNTCVQRELKILRDIRYLTI